MPEPPPRGHVLLACPPVFSYHLSIRAELESMGYRVTLWDDRGGAGSLVKVGLRILPALFAAALTSRFRRRLRSIDASSITRVLVVKGEGMSVPFIRSLRAALQPSARLSLYFWDSVDNAPRARTIAPLFDRVATFDPVDARALGWRYRPLFARGESIVPPAAGEAFRYDWCFIGTLHSDRYRVVERLRRNAPQLRSFFFGFAPSRVLLAARHLADWRLLNAPRGSVSTATMPTSQVAAIARASRAMLDVEHPQQRGLTMRTIETLLSQRKLVTTNRHVLETDLFDPSRVHVISREQPAIPSDFLESAFRPVEAEVHARYTLRRWIVDLIDEPGAA